MKNQAIKITSGSKIVNKLSNRFSNRDFNLLNALAFIKGYKFNSTTKSIIINNESYKVSKRNGFIYAGYKNLSLQINDKVYSTNKFLLGLQTI